jgi:hypothetical protein
MIENLWGRILLVLYFIPVFTVGMAGNLWVIFSVLRILHKTRNPLNYTFRHMAMYILSLSIADIAVSFFGKFFFNFNYILLND